MSESLLHEEHIIPTNIQEHMDNINKIQRPFGHNKLQLEIEELKTQILNLQSADKEKEMKMSLFKRSVATIQQQLQERNAYIIKLEQTINSSNTSINQSSQDQLSVISDLQNKLQKSCQAYDEQDIKYNVLLKDYDNITQISNQQSYIISKNEDEINELKKLCDIHTRTIQQLETEKQSITNQYNLSKHLFNQLEIEYTNLQQSFNKYKIDASPQCLSPISESIEYQQDDTITPISKSIGSSKRFDRNKTRRR